MEVGVFLHRRIAAAFQLSRLQILQTRLHGKQMGEGMEHPFLRGLLAVCGVKGIVLPQNADGFSF